MAYWPYTHNQNKAYLAIHEPAMAYWALFFKPKQGLLGHIQNLQGPTGPILCHKHGGHTTIQSAVMANQTFLSSALWTLRHVTSLRLQPSRGKASA